MTSDIGKELPRGRSPKAPDRRVSRRKFLGLSAGAAFVGHSFLRGAKANLIDAKTKAGEVTEATGRFLQGEGSPGEVVEALVGKEPTYLHLVYPNLPSEDMDVVKREAAAAGHSLYDFDKILRTVEYEGLIRNTAKAHGIPEELLLGLVLAESGGDRTAMGERDEGTGEQAKGLTQMMDTMARKYNLKSSDGDDDERFDPNKILPATAMELREYYESLGNWGLAFQEWHVGMPQLYKDILQPYFASAHGENLPSYKVEPADDTSEAKSAADLETKEILSLYRNKISEYGVTVYHLFKNPQIQETVASPGWENTGQYLPRIIGLYAEFEGNKLIAKS